MTEKLCSFCKKSFLATRSDRRFCSPRCQNRNWVKNHIERIRVLWNRFYERYPEKKKARSRIYREFHKVDPDTNHKAYRKWSVTERGRVMIRARMQRWRKTEKGRLYGSHARNVRYSLEKGAIGSHSYREWCVILSKVKGVCPMCKRNGLKLSKDHIIPLSMGGTNYLNNIQPLCRSCNSCKGGKNRVSVDGNSTGTISPTYQFVSL